MAVGRISGQLLKSNLLRNGVNLAFETDLLYIDVNNSRIGVNTASPQYPLDINGTARTTNLEVTTQAVINNITIGANSISTTASSLNITSPDGILYNNKLLIDDMEISGNTIKAMDSNQNFEIITSGTGIVEVFGDTRVNGNIHATGNIRADGNIQIGDADTDSISIAADFTSNITPDVTDTYNMGSAAKRWNDVYANNLIVDNLTLNGNITVQGLDLTARPGKIYYVATNGDDAKTGTWAYMSQSNDWGVVTVIKEGVEFAGSIVKEITNRKVVMENGDVYEQHAVEFLGNAKGGSGRSNRRSARGSTGFEAKTYEGGQSKRGADPSAKTSVRNDTRTISPAQRERWQERARQFESASPEEQLRMIEQFRNRRRN